MLRDLKRGSGCSAVDSSLHSSLNLAFRQRKLHSIFIFGWRIAKIFYALLAACVFSSMFAKNFYSSNVRRLTDICRFVYGSKLSR